MYVSPIERFTQRCRDAGTLMLGAWLITCPLWAQEAGDLELEKDYAQHALEVEGDPIRGKLIFEKDTKAQCSNCHRVTGMEKAGPNLDGIGSKYSRRELITHLLEPSRSIKQGYAQTQVLLHSGEVISGRLERSTRESIRILDVAGKQRNIQRDEIEQIQDSNVSLMPSGLAKAVSRQQFADLIAYLSSLRLENKKGLVAGGQPIEITHLAMPVPLVPIVPPEEGLENPVWVGPLPGSKADLIVLEHQSGRAWRLVPRADSFEKRLFLDLSDDIYYSGNQGLMCIAFHPDYGRNGRYFLEHEVREQGKIKTTIVERKASKDRLTDSGSPSIRLLEVEQPAFNHNGGCLAFGPDGMLYAGFGDGGPQRDPNGYSQSKRHFLGSFIRIDVDRKDAGKNYAIPSDNPFIDDAANDPTLLPEIYATGFREPWRFSFDPVTGQLWVGDVGQEKYEEVCLVRSGQNHGWNVREGFEAFSDEYHVDGTTYTDPLFAYEHGLGFSVTGGHVYRGDPTSTFYGVYIFGDYNTKRIWGLREVDGRVVSVKDLGSAHDGIASFGLDHAGELLLVTYDGGIFRLDLSACRFD